MSKSLKYIILIAILLVANFWLFFADSLSRDETTSNYFESKDLSAVSLITFIVDGKVVKLERSEQEWALNDNYKADQGFVNTLLSVLERVEVGRTIENWNQEVMGKVKVEIDGNESIQFQFATNPTKTKSYFIADGVAKEVAVPGYRDNVIDLFILHPDQWRDRLVFDGSWRTIQRVQVDNISEGQSFEIKFDDKFFLVNGQQPQDSTAVVNYLNQFEYFQANEMMSEGRFAEYDSLSATEPMATITLDDIKSEEPTVLTIFPSINDQRYHLVMKDGAQQMVVDARRVGAMLGTVE